MNSYLNSITKQFEYYRSLGEKAMAQVPDEALRWQPSAESNSIAIIVNHLAGNMLSRFTDFLHSDGEKSWRNRDSEFEVPLYNRKQLLQQWQNGWNCLLSAIAELDDARLETIVYIRNDGHTVTEAINRQLAHYAYHVGQIVFIAKMAQDHAWQSLSIPKNQSQSYNSRKFSNEKERRHFTDDL